MPTQLHRLFESLESRTLLHAGDIDPAFNSGQLQTTAFANSGATANVVDTLPDGSFLVGGTIYQKQHTENTGTNGQFAQAGIGIAKYNFDGTLDLTFGAAGEIAGTPRGLYNLSQIVNTPDGGFLVVGQTTDQQPIIVKYTAAGKIDTTFGTNGDIIPASFAAQPTQISVDSSGRILVPGQIGNNAVLRRYRATGQVDSKFGVKGDYIDPTTTSTENDEYYQRIFSAVAVNSNGNIIVTGSEYLHQTDQDTDHIIAYETIIREVKHTGTPYKPFNEMVELSGFTLNLLDNVAGILPDGTIVLSGQRLIELTPDADFNINFGDNANGRSGVTTDGQIAVSPDGSIITPFRVTTDTTSEFALRRILPNGKLDKNFGTDGKLVLSSVDNSGAPLDIGVAIAPDGTVVAASQAGTLSPSGKVDTRTFNIARVFTGNGPAVQIIPSTVESNTASIKVTALIRDDDGVDALTLDNHDLKVLDPANVSGENFFQRMHFVSSTQIDGDKYIQATYKVSSPNFTVPEATPTWDSIDNGTYQVRLAGSQIKDLLGNAAEAQILGDITIEIPA